MPVAQAAVAASHVHRRCGVQYGGDPESGVPLPPSATTAFGMEASSVAFLLEHGFDFNVCFRDGVTHVPKGAMREMLALARNKSVSTPKPPRHITPEIEVRWHATRAVDSMCAPAWVKPHSALRQAELKAVVADLDKWSAQVRRDGERHRFAVTR